VLNALNWLAIKPPHEPSPLISHHPPVLLKRLGIQMGMDQDRQGGSGWAGVGLDYF